MFPFQPHRTRDDCLVVWLSGCSLDTEINEIVEGSNLYTPKVDLDQVVLPKKLLDELLTTVHNFETFKRYRKDAQLEDRAGTPLLRLGFPPNVTRCLVVWLSGCLVVWLRAAYGAGLTVLVYGPSGTGKTMVVNGIAASLGKKILLVNFPMLQRSSSSAESFRSGGGDDKVHWD